MFSFILGLFVGVAMPVQTSINATLRARLKSPYIAAMSTFVIGTIGVAAVVLFNTGNLYLPLATVIEEPIWIWSGGFCGAMIVILSVVSLPKLGSVETMLMIVLGQIVLGLVIDNFGWFECEVIRLTILRFIGSALVLGGTVIVAMTNRSEGETKHEKKKGIWAYRMAALAVGVFAGAQIAINGRLGVVLQDSFKAALISMIVGLISVVVITIGITLFRGGRSAVFEDTPTIEGKWWMWVGGLFSVVIVGGNVVIAKVLGTGLSVILNVVGQTFGGVIVDAMGFLGIEKKPVTVAKVAGILIMIVGIVLVNM